MTKLVKGSIFTRGGHNWDVLFSDNYEFAVLKLFDPHVQCMRLHSWQKNLNLYVESKEFLQRSKKSKQNHEFKNRAILVDFFQNSMPPFHFESNI